MNKMDTKKYQNENLKQAMDEKELSARKKFFGKVFIFLILSLIIYEYYVYCFEVMYRNFSPKNLNETLTKTFIFHFLLFMMVWSLLVTMNTHPGEIPLYWVF
jgi:hypothetical protein